MITYDQFAKQFRLRPGLAWYVGVERECFVADQDGKIVPEAPGILAAFARGIQLPGRQGVLMSTGDAFGYELSACQLESRVGPCPLVQLPHLLEARACEQEAVLSHLGLQSLHREVGPTDMPLDVYPDPAGRYQAITAGMPRETLLAACRVIGTHVHVGMPDRQTALRVYNYVIRHVRELCAAGDGSNGERLAIYRQMAPECEPRPYESWRHYYDEALRRGFAEDPRKCWDLIRISVHGTLEFRMFGATYSIARIVEWARRCHEISETALAYA